MKIQILTIFLTTTIAISACHQNKEHSLYNGQELRAGDIVLRCGSGLTSRAVIVADNGGNYSHVGIVVDSSGVMMIVHAVPGEHDFPNDFDRVKMDEAKTFFLTTRTKNGRILRYSDSIVAQKAAKAAHRLYKSGIIFDHEYDISDTSALYCSELVEYAYKQAGILSITDGIRHDVNLPVFNYEQVILPSDFVHSSQLTTVSEF